MRQYLAMKVLREVTPPLVGSWATFPKPVLFLSLTLSFAWYPRASPDGQRQRGQQSRSLHREEDNNIHRPMARPAGRVRSRNHE